MAKQLSGSRVDALAALFEQGDRDGGSEARALRCARLDHRPHQLGTGVRVLACLRPRTPDAPPATI